MHILNYNTVVHLYFFRVGYVFSYKPLRIVNFRLVSYITSYSDCCRGISVKYIYTYIHIYTHGREFCSITFLSFSHLCFDKVSESLFQKKMSSTVFEESPNKLGILRRFPARQLNSSRIKKLIEGQSNALGK